MTWIIADKNTKLIISGSEKAGCTVAAKLFFNSIGKLKEALDYSPWIHDYRNNIYKKSCAVDDKMLKDPVYFKAKLVRNPFSRAVSSYIHCMPAISRIGSEEEHLSFKYKKLLELCEGKNDLSFREFISILGRSDISNHKDNNQHYTTQYNAKWEDGKSWHIFKIEHLEQELAIITKYSNHNFDIGGKILDSKHHANNIYNKVENKEFVGDMKWTNIIDNIPDNYKYFYDDSIIEEVAKLYQQDLVKYNYNFEDFYNYKSENVKSYLKDQKNKIRKIIFIRNLNKFKNILSSCIKNA